MSNFGWIHNHFASLGKKATPDVERFWRRLKSWVTKNGVQTSRFGPLDQSGHDLWAFAFPNALAAIKEGTPRA